jgi:lysophospholipase L1-like esterase
MKLNKFNSILILTALLVGSCKQEPIKPEPAVVETPTPTTPSAGTANFTKFVAIGNSLTAGYQAGALFNEGQQNSLGAILAKQFATVGGGAFNQPDINSVNGFNTTTTNPPVPGGPILGRLVLFDPDGTGPRGAGPAALGTPARTVSCPSSVSTPAVPGSGGQVPLPFTGNKAALNNFGVPGIQLIQVLSPATGGPANPPPPAAPINPAYNALYARFASNPSTNGVTGSTILADAVAANGSFFMFFLGNNDILGYATTGGSGAIPLTTVGGAPGPGTGFQAAYQSAINTLLTANPNSKGVIGNIPDVTTIPFFFTVTHNAITLASEQATALNAAFAGYNGVMDAIKASPALLALSTSSAANLDARKVTYTAGAGNRILIAEKSPEFPDLGATFDAILAGGGMSAAQRAALEPYRRVRQATATDLITLSAGGILGTCFNPPGNNATLIIGTSIPLADQFVLIPSEISAILTRTAELNAVIKAAADNSNNRIALADVNAAFKKLVTDRAQVINGVTITPTFAPPTGGFSEDGVHPNSRGSAYLANIFIDAINAKFGATIPKPDLSTYKGTALPLNP